MYSNNSLYFNQNNQSLQFEETKIIKNILIQSFDNNNNFTNHSFTSQYPSVYIPYDSINRQLDVGKVLHGIFFQILNPDFQYQIFYFSNISGYFHFGGIYPFKSPFKLGEQFIIKDQIFIAFRKSMKIKNQIIYNANQNNIQNQKKSFHQLSQAQPVSKKKRINDRSIKQILQKVSLWRTIYQKQKITYEDSAKKIDIPKKTLDDYYSLIRLGEEFGFSFESNLNQKIGVLRQFVKEKQLFKKNEQKKLNQKNNKVSIIDQMISKLSDSQEQEEE